MGLYLVKMTLIRDSCLLTPSPVDGVHAWPMSSTTFAVYSAHPTQTIMGIATCQECQQDVKFSIRDSGILRIPRGCQAHLGDMVLNVPSTDRALQTDPLIPVETESIQVLKLNETEAITTYFDALNVSDLATPSKFSSQSINSLLIASQQLLIKSNNHYGSWEQAKVTIGNVTSWYVPISVAFIVLIIVLIKKCLCFGIRAGLRRVTTPNRTDVRIEAPIVSEAIPLQNQTMSPPSPTDGLRRSQRQRTRTRRYQF